MPVWWWSALGLALGLGLAMLLAPPITVRMILFTLLANLFMDVISALAL